MARSISGEEPYVMGDGAPSISGAGLIPLASNRTDSVIKSSLGLIRNGERRSEGERRPPQVQPGTVAANENKSTQIKMMDSRTQLLTAPECQAVVVEHRGPGTPGIRLWWLEGKHGGGNRKLHRVRGTHSLASARPPSATLVLSGRLTAED